MATWKGLEPSTSAVTGRHSNQLNYQAVNLPISKPFSRGTFGDLKVVGGTGVEPVTYGL